ncbi:MAG: nucleoside deaminase [Pseudomonadota bacterium]
MAEAYRAACAAGEAGEVPVGAALFAPDGSLLAVAGNRVIRDRDPTAHAEIVAIRAAAAQLENERLTGCVLAVTLEPCTMCAGAIAQARIARLEFAAADPKGGGVIHGPRFFSQPTCHHRPEVVRGPMAQESASLLRAFFRARRAR